MLNILVDTCVWLDLAKDPKQQKLLRVLGELIQMKEVQLLVPDIIIEELNRNKEKIINANSQSLASVIKRAKQMVDMLGPDKTKGQVLDHLNDVNYKIPGLRQSAIGSLVLIEDLLKHGKSLSTTNALKLKAAERAIKKLAPFHHHKNSFNDALIIETFADCLKTKKKKKDIFTFITHNTSDFSKPAGNEKEPHPDFDLIFSNPTACYSINLAATIQTVGPELVSELMIELEDWEEKPREYNDILEAENEFFDRVWYHRHRMRLYNKNKTKASRNRPNDIETEIEERAANAAKRIENKYKKKTLWPNSDFDLGMINGKLSALRWVLGEDWDFLDT